MMCVYLFSVLAAIQILPGLSWNKDMEVPGMYQGDIELTPEQWEKVNKGQNAFGSIRGRRWPGGIIPYQIESSISSKGRTEIMKAIADYHKYTCLKFRPKSHTDRYFISFYNGKGCTSPVGRVGQNRISLNYPGCQNKGTILHEIGHSIGLHHEQCRKDRDKYVKVHYENIKDGLAFAFNIQNEVDSLDTPYDLASMMHYSSTAFSKNRRKTITTLDPSKQRLIDTYNRITGFSETDIRQINLMYKNECGKGTGSGCQGDKKQYCASWARSGYCKNQRYKTMMERDCCKSCGSS